MWMLFVIVLEANAYFIAPKGPFTSMEGCFKAREVVMAELPKPKINYEAVCIQTDQVESI